MAKLTLSDFSSLANQTSAIATLNANNTLIETALENTLSRDGTTPNTMSADLDMNSNQILNLPTPATDSEPATKGYVDAAALGALESVVTFDEGIVPDANDGAYLGTTALSWSDLFLASGGVINWNAGDVTITHSSNALAFGGASSGYTFDASLFLPSGAVLNFNSGDVTLTHSANTLTLAGGDLVLPSAGLTVGASVPFSDTAGTLTLQNIDALDATTEATIEAAIDTLGNLTLTGTPTAAGATWADLGAVTTVDINGGSIDGTTIGGSTAAAITGTTITANTGIVPDANDGAYLGQSGTAFSDLFLASGAVVNFDAGDITLTHSANDLALAGGTLTVPAAGLVVGASTPFSDSAGTLTLQNVDALDATTEATIESAIDTLANLTTIQGRTVTLADAGANAIFGWDDTAGAYENLSAAEATAVLNVFVGDSGSGGTKGLVPAPAAGDASKFLRGDGTYVAVAGGGDLLAANNLSDVANAATAFGNIKQAATDSATGVVELATTAEASTGTDTTRAVTAAGLQQFINDRRTDVLYDASLTSGTSVSITQGAGSWASGATYDEFVILVYTLSNSGTTGYLIAEVSDDAGSTWGTDVQISSALPNAAQSFQGFARILCCAESGTTKYFLSSITSGGTAAISWLGKESTETGVTTGIRVSCTAGTFDGSGTIAILGVNRIT